MKNTLFLFALLLSCALGAQKEVRSLDSFSKIKVSGGIELHIYDGNNEADIEIIKGELDKLMTEVKGQTLHIKFEKKSWSWNNGSAQARIKLYTSEAITEIEASAGADVSTAITLDVPQLYASASSGASADLKVKAGRVNGSASSGGSLKLEGKAGDVKFSASSGGSLSAAKLEAKTGEAKASSGASVKLWVTDHIAASAGSGGSVRYKGEPETSNINVGKYSGGSVSRM